MDIQLLLGNMRGYSATIGEFVDTQLVFVGVMIAFTAILYLALSKEQILTYLSFEIRRRTYQPSYLQSNPLNVGSVSS